MKKIQAQKYFYAVCLSALILSGCTNIKTLAEKGDAQAQWKLGFNYEAGIGVPRDFQKALYWYRLSAAQGNTWAQNSLTKLELGLNQRQAEAGNQVVNNATSVASQFDGSEGLTLGNDIHDVSVKLRNIDDLGLVIVRNPEGVYIHAKEVNWSVTNGAGAGEVSLNKNLELGTNLVILVLHNKTLTFGAGKWSFDFSLLGDGATLWHEAKKQSGGDSGIKYWMAFSVEKRTDGMLTVKKASQNQLVKLEPDMVDLNKYLVKNKGHENSQDAAIALGLFGISGAAIIGSGGNTSNSGNTESSVIGPKDDLRERQDAVREENKHRELEGYTTKLPIPQY